MSIVSVSVIVLSIIGGFYFVGTPGGAREQKLDGERVSALQTIQGQVVMYWNQKDKLPEQLDDLKDPLNGFWIPLDPETKQSYQYKKTGEFTFELCATFSRQTPQWEKGRSKPTYEVYDQYGNPMTDDWDHEAGEKCFERTIDPERHKAS